MDADGTILPATIHEGAGTYAEVHGWYEGVA